MDAKVNVLFIHGNGGATHNDHFFPYLKNILEGEGISVTAMTFPDNQAAHENLWIPYIKYHIHADENTVLVGHSSGGVAALRYAEENKIFGSALIGVNYTDLGDATEKESGYYGRPWNWNAIRKNQNWILQFASTDDPYIPISEPRFIHDKLNSAYYEFTDRGHFMTPKFPELADKLLDKLK